MINVKILAIAFPVANDRNLTQAKVTKKGHVLAYIDEKSRS
jgi:hypothetical protein